MSFEKIPALLSEALTARGYTACTPVQAAVIEDEARGRDLVVSAQTGSGKTVAFGLALATDLLDDGERARVAGAPLALVVAPTRELALQVSRELTWLYQSTGARVTTCVGGMNPSQERRALAQGAQIVVGTPGRLRDHLERGSLDLRSLAAVVLDEADEMLDMGFREDLEELLGAAPEGRRTLLFSATMPKPIVALARRYQKDALRISTVEENRGHGDISYQAVTIAPADIERAVVNLLRFHNADTAMLFCATRDNVRHLHASLTERGFAAVALSGEHSQNERNQALQALRDRRVKVCVATDVAARGIDLPSLSLVIHVEIPRDAEALQHRSGRTGRAGKKGTAVLLVPYPRRRRVEGMLRDARISADWIAAPTASDIRRADSERLIEGLLAPIEFEEEDREIAARLIAEMTPEDIAAALVYSHRAKLPRAEEMLAADTPRAPREGFTGSAWFKMSVGRNHNADARWILPLLCRRGHVGREDIGAIRIAQNETLFEIAEASAARFLAAVNRSAGGDDDGDGVEIIAVEGTPREAARHNRRDGPNEGRHDPRPPLGVSNGPGNGPRGPRPPHGGPRGPHAGPRSAKPFHKGPGDGGARPFAGKKGPGGFKKPSGPR